MIKNVVFDFGNVLIKFDPEYMVSRYTCDREDARLLGDVIFDRIYWDRLDKGTISDAEVVALAKERLPARLHEMCEQIYYNWVHNIPPIPGMWEIVSRIKREYGVRTFLLSDISRYFAGFESEFSVLAEMDKCIYSAVSGYTKPHPEAFLNLCNTCNILPEETLFIDDRAANIDGAASVGITGYRFDGDSARLSDYLDNILKPNK